MYSQKIIHRFIELKSQNIPHNKIASELRVSERTLNNWTKKYYNDILYRKQIELDQLKSQLNIADVQHLEFYSKIIEKCKKLLLETDLEKIECAYIFKIFSLAVSQVQKCRYLDLEKVKFKDNSEEEDINPIPNSMFFNSMFHNLKK